MKMLRNRIEKRIVDTPGFAAFQGNNRSLVQFCQSIVGETDMTYQIVVDRPGWKKDELGEWEREQLGEWNRWEHIGGGFVNIEADRIVATRFTGGDAELKTFEPVEETLIDVVLDWVEHKTS